MHGHESYRGKEGKGSGSTGDINGPTPTTIRKRITLKKHVCESPGWDHPISAIRSYIRSSLGYMSEPSNPTNSVARFPLICETCDRVNLVNWRCCHYKHCFALPPCLPPLEMSMSTPTPKVETKWRQKDQLTPQTMSLSTTRKSSSAAMGKQVAASKSPRVAEGAMTATSTTGVKTQPMCLVDVKSGLPAHTLPHSPVMHVSIPWKEHVPLREEARQVIKRTRTQCELSYRYEDRCTCSLPTMEELLFHEEQRANIQKSPTRTTSTSKCLPGPPKKVTGLRTRSRTKRLVEEDELASSDCSPRTRLKTGTVLDKLGSKLTMTQFKELIGLPRPLTYNGMPTRPSTMRVPLSDISHKFQLSKTPLEPLLEESMLSHSNPAKEPGNRESVLERRLFDLLRDDSWSPMLRHVTAGMLNKLFDCLKTWEPDCDAVENSTRMAVLITTFMSTSNEDSRQRTQGDSMLRGLTRIYSSYGKLLITLGTMSEKTATSSTTLLLDHPSNPVSMTETKLTVMSSMLQQKLNFIRVSRRLIHDHLLSAPQLWKVAANGSVQKLTPNNLPASPVSSSPGGPSQKSPDGLWRMYHTEPTQ